jgi:hypothetical protein
VRGEERREGRGNLVERELRDVLLLLHGVGGLVGRVVVVEVGPSLRRGGGVMIVAREGGETFLFVFFVLRPPLRLTFFGLMDTALAPAAEELLEEVPLLLLGGGGGEEGAGGKERLTDSLHSLKRSAALILRTSQRSSRQPWRRRGWWRRAAVRCRWRQSSALC